MYILLIISLLILLVININLFRRQPVNPNCIFCGMLLLSIIFGLFWYSEWDLSSFSVNSYLAIFLGCGSFSSASWIIHYLFYNKKEGGYNEKGPIEVGDIKWGIAFIFEITTAILAINFFGGFGGNISQSIIDYRVSTSYFNVDTMPSYLSLMINICLVNGVVSGYALANNTVFYRKIPLKWLALTLLSMGISLFGGSRGGAVSILISTIMSFLSLMQKKINGSYDKKKMYKFLISCLIGGVIFAILFVESANWIGRTIEDGPMYYFAIYFSAPLKNLDLNIRDLDNGLNISNTLFRSINGHSLGNVGTVFTDEYMIGNYLGIIVISFIYGLLATLLYESVRYKRIETNSFSLAFIIYSYVLFAVSMALFGNTMLISLTTTYAIKTLVGIIAIVVLYSLKVKDGKILIKKWL